MKSRDNQKLYFAKNYAHPFIQYTISILLNFEIFENLEKMKKEKKSRVGFTFLVN